MTGRAVRSILLVLVILLCVPAVPGPAFAGQKGFPRVFVREASRYPDLTQTDLRARFSLGGWFHCGPVAVSNALIWFRERGIRFGPSFPQGRGPEDQIEVARTLGRAGYMDTRFGNGGTTVHDFVTGLDRYLADYALDRFSILYMGWGAVPERFATGKRAPDLEELCRAFSEGGAVFLDLGWYRQDRSGKMYRRDGGHWVTLVGYRWPEGHKLPELLIHDPAPWSGKDPATHIVHLEESERVMFGTVSGELVGSMEPYARIAGGLSFKRGAEIALIEGAVVLTPRVRPAVPWRDGQGR